MAQHHRRQVCLFGLSADPPTGYGGHVGIVQALTSHAEFEYLDEIRILPVYRHTYASKRQRLVSFEHRLNMCRAAFGDIPKTTVSDAEYQSWAKAVENVSEEERSKVSVGTAALLEYLQSIEPDTDFTFCLGADAFLDLTDHKWKESKRVLDLLQGRLLVLERDQSQQDNHGLLQERISTTPGAKLLVVEHLNDVSSSQVRACSNIQQLETMVVPAVLEYMQEHRLYALGEE